MRNWCRPVLPSPRILEALDRILRVTYVSHWRYKEEQLLSCSEKMSRLMLRHIQTFGLNCPCLQCVNICCVFVGDISFEIKNEADRNDITEYQHDDVPNTGMIVSHYESILCTTFAFMFMSFYYKHQNK